MFWDQMILRLAKLTDPHKKGSDKNLSVYILQQLASENNWGFSNEINMFLDEVKDMSKPIRKYRSKLLVHQDLPIAMSKVAAQAPDLIVTLDQVDKVLTAIGEAINLIYGNFAKPI